MITARELLALIRDLDSSVDADSSYDEAGIPYAYVIRWNASGGSGGESDDKATALFRQMLRERLGALPLEEIGAATLADIDERAAK